MKLQKRRLVDTRKMRDDINSEYSDLIYDVMDGIYDEDIEDIKNGTQDIYDVVYQAIGDEVIYYADQWTIMIHYYINPVDITTERPYYEAVDEFANDVVNQLRKDFNITDSKRKLRKDSYKRFRR